MRWCMATQRTIHENSYGFFCSRHIDLDEYVFYIHIQRPHVSCTQRNKSEMQTAHVFAGFMRRLTNRFKCYRSLIHVYVCASFTRALVWRANGEKNSLPQRKGGLHIYPMLNKKRTIFQRMEAGHWTVIDYEELHFTPFNTNRIVSTVFFKHGANGCTVVMCELCTNTYKAPDEQPV